MMPIPRRLTATLALTLALALPAAAQDWITSSTLIGPSKYEDASKTHYDHVNPDAPKGGELRSAALGTFDSFNPYIVQGTPAGGLNYQGGLLWDTLMEKGVDEASASHPLIAEKWSHSEDYSQATYVLDADARWHDGKPITAEDVEWSMATLKEHSPTFNRYFANVSEVRIDDPRTITFIFDEKNNRELPLIIGDLPVLPKHWWTASGADGEPRDFTKSSLEMPLGSGPYRIRDFAAGDFIEWERVPDYWAADTLTRKGRYNVDTRRITYFKDPNAIWEAFKKGGFTDIRAENRSQYWAELYNFPAFENKDVIKEVFTETGTYPFQGYYLNTRRDKFSDPRVRKALQLAMNFEGMNERLFYGLYKRTKTYFGGSELSAPDAAPEGRELEILEGYRGRIPDAVFEGGWSPAVYESPRDQRKFLREAFDLLKEAGYERKGTSMVGPDGKPFTLEILGFNPSSERVNAPWMQSLERLGIDVSFRVVDTSQYIARINEFDYDVISTVTQQSSSPGNEQREYWTSLAADQKGSRNYSGIKDPVVDELVDKLIFAKDRAELVAHTRALDRILLHGNYAIPQWHNPAAWVARWDKFGIPRPQPSYVGYDPESWWVIAEREAELKAKY